MSVDISKVKAEIKEWQRAYRRAHGCDPGKEELKKNPEMQAKYKLWQDSLKADKDKASRKSSVNEESRDDEMDTTPPKRAPKSIVPKKMPVQSASAGPATPFSARKKAARKLAESPTSPSSEQASLPKLKQAIPAPNLSASKSRTASSQSSRVIPFNSASSARHRTFPGMSQSLLDSDSDDDDNPFSTPGPASPTGARSRRSSQLISPSKSVIRRQTSSVASTPQSAMKGRSANFDLSPTRPSGTNLAMMTPRTKARKRMRGEEVPATPGDKRRKLGLAAADKPATLFGEPSGRGTKRLTPENEEDDDDEEIIDSPKKKSAFGVNGRVFTSMFDDTSSAVASTKDDEASLRSTPPPPPSESGDSYAPDWEDAHDSADDEPETTAAPTNTRNKPLFPVAPGKWTQDTWDAPAPGTDLSHLRKGIAKAGASDKGKGKAPKQIRRGSQSDGDEKAKKSKDKTNLSNPFELLPPMPGEESTKPGRRYDNGEPRSKGRSKAETAALKKRAKEAAEPDEGEDQSDGDAVAEFNEVEWRPHGPLRAAPSSVSVFSQVPVSNSQTSAPDEPIEDEHDPAENLPSELRTLLSIQSTRREDIKVDALARDILAGRATRGGEVWGIGDVESNDDGDDGEHDDWDSEPEGWTGGVEM